METINKLTEGEKKTQLRVFLIAMTLLTISFVAAHFFFGFTIKTD